MKERPISFRKSLLQKVVQGRKIETRRMKGLDTINANPDQWDYQGCDSTNDLPKNAHSFVRRADGFKLDIKCPYGVNGDGLWVREKHIQEHEYPNAPVGHENFDAMQFVYELDKRDQVASVIRWTPPFLMPKKACRYRLQIVSIGCERLHDITEAAAIAEGFEPMGMSLNALEVFEAAWDFANDKYTWTFNPWCWVVKFKLAHD